MDFQVIDDFPTYSVNSLGQIRNDDTDRIMALTMNQHGVVQVGLMRHGVQHKRSVALLVAKAFLDPPALEAFDTPIHLDGDRFNNRVDNLMWRPRWFAIKYQQQFVDFHGPLIPNKMIEIKTKAKVKNSWHAATKFGLLDEEIYQAAVNRTYVWPTYQYFRIID